MNVPLPSAEDRLIEALAAAARGPERNGIFAVWLFARVAEGLIPPVSLSECAQRHRLEKLHRRLSSLAVPPPLRRALTAAMRQIADGTAGAAAIALHQLVAPARETIGPEVADALALAARQARATGSANGDS
ncbi:MAG: hypothetical protein IH965_06335 [Gemmatimonadetes bacterium]|nr:hypothetical protein [Gemmatimonadota bacterium]